MKITINKDKNHLNGENLTTQTEENMNLMFYDFNNPAVILEETQRNILRSQTTDRGPSRKLRSRGRFKLASSNQQKRGDVESAGYGEIRPFEASSEFEMGMYPPGQAPLAEEDLPSAQRLNMRIENTPDAIMNSSPQKAERRGVKNNSKSGNRNL